MIMVNAKGNWYVHGYRHEYIHSSRTSLCVGSVAGVVSVVSVVSVVGVVSVVSVVNVVI